MKRYLILFFSIFFLTGCSRCSVCVPDWLKLPKMDCSYFRFPWSEDDPYLTEEKIVYDVDEQEMTRVVWYYANEMMHEKRLRLEDSRLFVKGGMISKIRLSFTSQDLKDLCDARALLVDVTEGMMERVQENEFLSGYLPTDFGAKNMEIYINFESDFGLFVDPAWVGWAILQDGISYFYAFDVKDDLFEFTFWHDRVEQYYKSLQIVTFQREAEESYKQSHETKKETKLNEVELFDNPHSSVIHDQ
jgi:hypothetical protein